MSAKECWGKTSHEIIKIRYAWTIEHYGLLRRVKLTKGLKSPKFPNDGSKLQFCLELFPAEDEEEECAEENQLKMRLHTLFDSLQKGYVRFYCPGCAVDLTYYTVTFCGPLKISITNFLNEHDTYLSDENLTLHCEITLIGNRIEKSGQQGNQIEIPSCKLAEDLGAILNTQEFADVTIITADSHKIPVHKNILSARSKVFAAMFKHPMKENTENCVVISDFKFDVLSELTRFVYTGEAPNLPKMSEDLLAAADKYELDRLKAMCVKSMSDNLSVETAHLVLRTADLYDLKDLKSKAIQFIQSNIRNVCDTFNWKDLLATLMEQMVDELKLDHDSSSGPKIVQ